jgi:trehalose/maltose hydrolase-like predicted phosphorylase
METRSWDGNYRGTYLGNGYLGQRMMQSGIGMGLQGPLPAYTAGLYEAEHLAVIPSPLALDLRVGDQHFGADPARVKDFHQSLDMRRDVLTTEATWDTGQGAAHLTITAFVARHQPELTGVRIVIKTERDFTLKITRPETGGELVGMAAAEIEAAGRRLTAHTASGKSFLVQEDRLDLRGDNMGSTTPAAKEVSVALRAGYEATISRLTASVWATRQADAMAHVARVMPVVKRGWDAVLQDHEDAWSKLWDADIVIDGNPEVQQIVRSWMFYLLQSVRPGTQESIPPMGLSDAAFAGHVFWDAETWMFPALVLQHPDMAKSMLEYRFRTLPGAVANAKAEGKQGASFAWESAATGSEQTPPGMHSRYGRHVTGDIALAFRQYWLATGDRQWLATRAWPVLSATAEYWVSRATPAAGGGFGILQVATPDENAGIVDNSAWTNYIAAKNLAFATEAARILGRKSNPRWAKVAAGLKLPRDPATGMILQSAGYKGLKIKQTDALLLIHPGEMPLSEAERGKLYDYYAQKTIAVGPAMSDSIHTIVAAGLGRGEQAYKHFQESYRPFLRPPFLYFSEKRTRDNFYFHTGAGGCLQSVLYGFGGLRFRDRPQPTVEHPLLPDAWNSLEIRRIRWRGKDWDVRVEKGKPPTLKPHSSASKPVRLPGD